MAGDNPFRGINPHLNSLLQTPGSEAQPAIWPSFHARHVGYIADFLNDRLPEDYIAFSEQSLQSRGDDWGGIVTVRRPQPDVTVFRHGSGGDAGPSPAHGSVPTWEADIAETIDPEDLLTAVMIRRVVAQGTLGTPVTRLELLSPSNKPGGSDYAAYRSKRIDALQSGLPLVEIDYLHESPPVLKGLPRYPHQPGSAPYTIAVSDPRPVWQEGHVQVYAFHVDEPVATVPVPLDGDAAVLFDFEVVYQHTFARGRWSRLIDMQADPVRIETYSAEDRARIRAKQESA